MTRSAKKGPFVAESLLKKVLKARKSGSRKTSQTYCRSSMVIPDFIGLTIPVHNGKKFINVLIMEDMVGHRLGEFAPTRFFRGHGAAHSKEIAEEIKK